MKMEIAMALARRFTGTDSKMRVLTGPVERNKRNMEAAKQLIASAVFEVKNAAKAKGTANSTEMPSTRAYAAGVRLCHAVAAKPPRNVPINPATNKTMPKNKAADWVGIPWTLTR